MTTDELWALGDFIRSAREAKGMTQAQLGALVGLSRPSITLLERGETKHPKINHLAAIADALGVDAVAMFQAAGITPPGELAGVAGGTLRWLESQLDPPNIRRLVLIGRALLQEQQDQPRTKGPRRGQTTAGHRSPSP